jgi:hypothetical protein
MPECTPERGRIQSQGARNARNAAITPTRFSGIIRQAEALIGGAMNSIPIKEQILQEVDKLNPQQQERLLYMVRQMQQATPPGTPGEVWLENHHLFDFAPGDLAEMLKVIEEEREKIDWESWE